MGTLAPESTPRAVPDTWARDLDTLRRSPSAANPLLAYANRLRAAAGLLPIHEIPSSPWDLFPPGTTLQPGGMISYSASLYKPPACVRRILSRLV
jgi:hypothetical protein